MVKICTDCKLSKPLEQFPAEKRSRDGHMRRCSECQRKIWARRKAAQDQDRLNAKKREWRKNTEVGRATVRKYGLVRRIGKGHDHATAIELRERWDEYRGKCAYCAFADAVEWDHYIPLKRGGSDTIENLFPSCADCNRGRGGKFAKLPIFEWA